MCGLVPRLVSSTLFTLFVQGAQNSQSPHFILTRNPSDSQERQKHTRPKAISRLWTGAPRAPLKCVWNENETHKEINNDLKHFFPLCTLIDDIDPGTATSLVVSNPLGDLCGFQLFKPVALRAAPLMDILQHRKQGPTDECCLHKRRENWLIYNERPCQWQETYHI